MGGSLRFPPLSFFPFFPNLNIAIKYHSPSPCVSGSGKTQEHHLGTATRRNSRSRSGIDSTHHPSTHWGDQEQTKCKFQNFFIFFFLQGCKSTQMAENQKQNGRLAGKTAELGQSGLVLQPNLLATRRISILGSYYYLHLKTAVHKQPFLPLAPLTTSIPWQQPTLYRDLGYLFCTPVIEGQRDESSTRLSLRRTGGS